MSKKHRNANSVAIDPAKFKHFFWLRRLTLSAVGPMIGRCDDWASCMAHKGHINYWTLDELAIELSLRVDDLITAFGAPEELERLSA